MTLNNPCILSLFTFRINYRTQMYIPFPSGWFLHSVEACFAVWCFIHTVLRLENILSSHKCIYFS